jgi:multidrug efflux pump subunit AcrB
VTSIRTAPSFSLNDRQVPIRVALPNRRARPATLRTCRCRRGGGSVPLKSVAEISFGPADTVQRTIRSAHRVGADLAPGLVSATCWPRSRAADIRTCRRVTRCSSATQVAGRADQQLHHRGRLGILLVFAVLVLLYKRVWLPFVKHGLLLSRASGRRCAQYQGDPCRLRC